MDDRYRALMRAAKLIGLALRRVQVEGGPGSAGAMDTMYNAHRYVLRQALEAAEGAAENLFGRERAEQGGLFS